MKRVLKHILIGSLACVCVSAIFVKRVEASVRWDRWTSYDREDSDNYYFDSNFYYWSDNWSNLTEEGTYVQEWNEQPYLPNGLYSKGGMNATTIATSANADLGFRATEAKWTGAVTSPSTSLKLANPWVVAVKPAKATYTRPKTTPYYRQYSISEGSGNYIQSGSSYWIKPGTTLNIQTDARQDFLGSTDALRDYINGSEIRFYADTDDRARFNDSGNFNQDFNSGAVNISSVEYSRSNFQGTMGHGGTNIDSHASFNAKFNNDNRDYLFQGYLTSANGKALSDYTTFKKDGSDVYIKTDGTAPLFDKPYAKDITNDGFTVVVPNITDQGRVGTSKVTTCTWITGWNLDGVWDEYPANDNQTLTFYFPTSKLRNRSGKYEMDIRTVDKLGNTSDAKHISIDIERVPEPPSQNLGNIIFDPNHTDWTNQGKTGEGSGNYTVNAKYTGTNPYIKRGSVTIRHEEGSKVYDYTEYFYAYYQLASISVSGSENTTVSGANGNFSITHEGENLILNGSGNWNSPTYSYFSPGDYERVISVDVPGPPDSPTGSSGIFKIDWTKPNITLDKATGRWINTPSPYPVHLKINDDLSGLSSYNVSINDTSHYSNNKNDVSTSSTSYDKIINLVDGMYKISVNAKDQANNENSDSSETYLIDSTKPEANFNISSQIFSEANGAVRKLSSKGNGFAFYGTVTAKDNLSGLSKIQYAWTYGNTSPPSYEIIYQTEYTYNDRSSEVVTREIEKPVGDNLYLHVQLSDTAGNITDKVFGPYEDVISLKNYEVTDVRDPNWKSVFWNDTDPGSFTNPKGTLFKSNGLPIDDKSHPTLKNAYPKKGYAFYFDITSEFLYRYNDRIEITPSFYYMNGSERVPLDLYYNNNNNPLVALGSDKDDLTINMVTNKYGTVLIGGLSNITLTKGVRIVNGTEWLGSSGWKNQIQYTQGKEQWWYGKYYIPPSSVFVKHGLTARPENIIKTDKIIVNFQIIAYKNGVETTSLDQMFLYMPKQWQLEGGPKSPDYKEGDVIVYDNKYSSLSDYQTYVIQ